MRRLACATLWCLALAALQSCGENTDKSPPADDDEQDGDDEAPSPADDQGESNAGDADGMDDDAMPDAASDDDAGADDASELIPGSPVCDRLRDSLRQSPGARIQVEPAGDGLVSVAGELMTLRSVVQTAAARSTIELAPGVYELPEAADGEYTGLYFTEPDVTLRGSSGNPADVVIDSAYRDHGEQTAPISVDAAGVVLSDFTVRRSIFHLIHLWANADMAVVFNVVMEDGGQQFLKASPGEGTVDSAQVSCSTFRMTDEGRDNVWGYGEPDGSTTCYTGGIDTHDARDWVVRYNQFDGIYCDTDPGRPAHGKKAADRGGQSYAGGLAEHAIHMWNSEQGSAHEIYGNTIVNCARGIGIGLVDPVYGTRVVNNAVFSSFPASAEHDVGIIVEHGTDVELSHNTVFFSHADAYPQGIEIRWEDTSNVSVTNNLSNRGIRERDGATATQTNNVTDAAAALFANADAGDLHLADCSMAPSAARLDTVTEDIDGEMRSADTPLGADACSQD